MRGHGGGNRERRPAGALALVTSLLAAGALLPLAVAGAQDPAECPADATQQTTAETQQTTAECPPPTEPAPPPEPPQEPPPVEPPAPQPTQPPPPVQPVVPRPSVEEDLPARQPPRCPKPGERRAPQDARERAGRRRARCCERGGRVLRRRGGSRCRRRATPRRRRTHAGVRRRAASPRAKKVRLRRGTPEQRLVPIHRLGSRPLPDPLPAGKRLDAAFARLLGRIAEQEEASWALVLAVLRERGRTGAAPAGAKELRALARRLDDGRPANERVAALAAYHRAVGLEGLVRGLHAVKRELGERVLRSRRIALYPGGRGDVEAGRIDVRVLVLMLYLAERRDGITVTSLIAGHSLLTKSGGVSLHAFGAAVDISALDGVPVLGHQQPGGVTERALRDVLLLPAELRPSELISLFELGGPSFAMADHADHLHVGY